MDPTKQAYEEDLKRRQAEHLRRVAGIRNEEWRPCMHDNCPRCCGTGIASDGSGCVHMMSCPCPKCTPRYS